MAEATSDLPLVSIIIPSFNHRRFVEEGIRAALAQTYERCEIIVIDDCSSDGSGEFLQSLATELDFQLLRNERNLGLNATLERGLQAAKGSYVSMIASDDRLAPDKVEWQVDYLQRSRLDGLYATGWLLHDDGLTDLIDLADLEHCFAHSSALNRIYTDDTRGPLLQSALIKREVILAVWRERGEFKSDDWFTLIRLLERHSIGFVNRPCFFYRQHEGNSYRNYWQTLPMRLEIVCNLTPEQLRPRAMANIIYSLGIYLSEEGQTAKAVNFMTAAGVLDPSAGRIARTALTAAKSIARKLAGRGRWRKRRR